MEGSESLLTNYNSSFSIYCRYQLKACLLAVANRKGFMEDTGNRLAPAQFLKSRKNAKETAIVSSVSLFIFAGDTVCVNLCSVFTDSLGISGDFIQIRWVIHFIQNLHTKCTRTENVVKVHTKSIWCLPLSKCASFEHWSEIIYIFSQQTIIYKQADNIGINACGMRMMLHTRCLCEVNEPMLMFVWIRPSQAENQPESAEWRVTTTYDSYLYCWRDFCVF